MKRYRGWGRGPLRMNDEKDGGIQSLGRVMQLANKPLAPADRRIVQTRKRQQKKRLKLHEADAKAYAERLAEPWMIVKADKQK